MNFLLLIFTVLFGKKVGMDEFGNTYYFCNSTIFFKKRRWVVYKGVKEPSKVPDYWEAWLRFTVDKSIPHKAYFWQKMKIPNLTGTIFKFNPKKYNKSIASYNDYTSWRS